MVLVDSIEDANNVINYYFKWPKDKNDIVSNKNKTICEYYHDEARLLDLNKLFLNNTLQPISKRVRDIFPHYLLEAEPIQPGLFYLESQQSKGSFIESIQITNNKPIKRVSLRCNNKVIKHFDVENLTIAQLKMGNGLPIHEKLKYEIVGSELGKDTTVRQNIIVFPFGISQKLNCHMKDQFSFDWFDVHYETISKVKFSN